MYSSSLTKGTINRRPPNGNTGDFLIEEAAFDLLTLREEKIGLRIIRSPKTGDLLIEEISLERRERAL